MNRYDLTILGCRLVAVYVAVDVMASLLGLPARVEMCRHLLTLSTDWDIARLIGSLVARLLCSVLLWILAPKLVSLVFATSEPLTQQNASSLATSALFLFGIAMLFPAYLQPDGSPWRAGQGLANMMQWLVMGPSVNMLQWLLESVAADLIRVTVALWLMYRGEELIRLCMRAKSLWRGRYNDQF